MAQGNANTSMAADATAPVNTNFATTQDIASTEAKQPGCTIAVATGKHPFDPSRTLVYVVGRWADGQYAAFQPAFKQALKDVRPGGGAYFTAAGHYRLGMVAEVSSKAALDTLIGWLNQAQEQHKARFAQVAKPGNPVKTGAKEAVLPSF